MTDIIENNNNYGRYIFIGIIATVVFFVSLPLAYAQNTPDLEVTDTASSTEIAQSATASATAEEIISNQTRADQANVKDVTKPEELPEKVAILSLFESRPVEEPSLFSFLAFWVQEAVRNGIPANTIFLILLIPVLATLVSFVRVVIGLPALDILVPVTLSFAFVAVGVFVGLFILGAVIVASYVSKFMLAKTKIMFYPKRSLSMFLLAFFVFAALTIAVVLGFDRLLSVSIFPILILILLGDSIVSVQLYKSAQETMVITSSTLAIGLIGYFLGSSQTIQDTIILYPELVLLAIPINIMIGRYFGLRLAEYFRFGQSDF